MWSGAIRWKKQCETMWSHFIKFCEAMWSNVKQCEAMWSNVKLWEVVQNGGSKAMAWKQHRSRIKNLKVRSGKSTLLRKSKCKLEIESRNLS